MPIDITNKEEKQIALTGTQIEETLLQAHLSKDAIAKIEGLEASASEIDGNILKIIKNINGLTITTNAVKIDIYAFEEQSVNAIKGVWFLGFDIYRKRLIILPRNIHRGWICFARFECDGTTITNLTTITIQSPKSRTPNTIKKILGGKPIKVLVMGSSLASAYGSSSWAGMLFDAESSIDKYKIPTTTTLLNVAIGGSPNKYQLIQTGLLNTFYGHGSLGEAGYSSLTKRKHDNANGRSNVFNEYDLIVLTCLANDGNNRLEAIEPLLRNLKKLGKEVIVCSDNAQFPTMDFDTLLEANLYKDGNEVRRLCDKYGFEFADTASYMFTDYLRGYSVYLDTIHPNGAIPNGPDSDIPSCGREVWARAIRSSLKNYKDVMHEYQNKMPDMIWSDYRMIGDCATFLSKDILYGNGSSIAKSPNSGGGNSYILGNGYVLDTESILQVPTGGTASVGGFGVNSAAVIYHNIINEAVTFEVRVNNVLLKTITLPALTSQQKWFKEIVEQGDIPSNILPSELTVKITVTSGTLYIDTIGLFTSENDYIKCSDIKYTGSWSYLNGGSYSMYGYATETNGDFATFKVPEDGRVSYFILTSRVNSLPVLITNEKALSVATTTSGVSHIKVKGGLKGGNTDMHIQLSGTPSAVGDSTNGYALHVGGAIVIKDRL